MGDGFTLKGNSEPKEVKKVSAFSLIVDLFTLLTPAVAVNRSYAIDGVWYFYSRTGYYTIEDRRGAVKVRNPALFWTIDVFISFATDVSSLPFPFLPRSDVCTARPPFSPRRSK